MTGPKKPTQKTKPEQVFLNLILPIGSIGLVYLPTWMADFYGRLGFFADLCLGCPWFFGERSVRLQVTSFKGIVGDDMKWPPVLLVIVGDLCFKWSDLILAGAGFETICKVGVSFFKVYGITPSRVPAANARNSRKPMAGSPGTED